MTKRTLVVSGVAKRTSRVDVHDREEDDVSIRQNVAANRRALEKFDAKQEYRYPIERITQDKIVIRNVKFPGADEAYSMPHQALMRFVSAYYPNAKGGPLYVDEPKNETEVHRAYERHKVMIQLKLRHVILEKDSTYEHLLEQLGEM